MLESRIWLTAPPLGINLLALGVGFHRRRTLGPPLKLMLGYLTLCAATTLGLEALAHLHGNNRILVHLFAPIQFLAFAWMYAGWAPRGLGRLFQLLAVGYALACLVMLPQENLSRFDGPSFHLQTLLLMGCSLALLCHLALQVDRPLIEHPGAWVAAGVLCDMAVSLVLYAARDWLLLHATGWMHRLLLGRSLVVGVSYLCFLRALTLGALPRDNRD